MWTIRRFEEAVDDLFARGLMHGTMHLSIGQEASATGACLALRDDDAITSTHRGHGHCIAKGADLTRMMAELLGKETGYCRGRGGSMHIADVATGNLGANGIVGGGIPIAAGAALAYQLRGEDRVVACFFGDGATNEGAFHEALNLAAIWKLPVVFVCENNKYGMSFSTEKSMAVDEHRRARAAATASPASPSTATTSRPCTTRCSAAVERARAGDGPDARRERDLPLEGPQQERQEPLPHQGGDRRVARARTRSCGSRPWSASAACSPTRTIQARPHRGHGGRSADAVRTANAAPDADPSDLLDAVFAPA